MRAVVVGEFGPIDAALKLGELPKPIPKPHEVLVEVRATAANFVDLLVIGGKYQFLPERPFAPGKLPSGVVAEVGSEVKNLKPGDRVITMAEHGGYAAYVAVPATHCYLLPEKLSFEEAAAMSLVYDTSWFALRDRGRIQPGETVLVLGATGGVGLAAIQLAKAIGAKVLAGVSSASKSDIVREAGADEIIDLSRPNLRDSLREQVYAVTDTRGADIVLDPLGGDIFDAALRAVAWRGRVVVIGFAAGRIPTLKVNYLMLKNMEVSGLQVSDYRKRMPEQMAACFAEIFSWYQQGKLKPLPTTIYPLEQFSRALHEIEDRKVRGRIVLRQGNK
jgi:NADPH2:quinone reductase